MHVSSPLGYPGTSQGFFNAGDEWNNEIDYLSLAGSEHCVLDLWHDKFTGTWLRQTIPVDQKDVNTAGFSDEQASSWRISFNQPACGPEDTRRYPGFTKQGVTVQDTLCTPCADDAFKPAGAKWSTQCQTHTDCAAGNQYTKTRGTRTSDAVCVDFTECADSQIDTSPTKPSSDQDRVCTDMIKYSLFHGVWQLASTSGTITYTAQSTFTSTETTDAVSAKSFERGLSDALSLGAKVSFGGGFAAGGVSANAGVELSTQYSTTESQHWTESVSKMVSTGTAAQESAGVSCTQHCEEQGVEAYVFKVLGQLPNGRVDEVETCNFACVPLASKDPVPKCPPGKCGNAACSCCDDDAWIEPSMRVAGFKVPVCGVEGDARAAIKLSKQLLSLLGKGEKKGTPLPTMQLTTQLGKGKTGKAPLPRVVAVPAPTSATPDLVPQLQSQLAAARSALQTLQAAIDERDTELLACLRKEAAAAKEVTTAQLAEPEPEAEVGLQAQAESYNAAARLRIRGRHI